MYPPSHEIKDRPSARTRALRKWGTITIGSLLLLVTIWFVISFYRAATAVQSLIGSQQKIDLILENGLMRTNPTDLNELATDIRADIQTLSSAIGPAAYLSPLFGWLPKYGPLLANGRELLEFADLGTEAGVYALRAITPALVAVQSSDSQSAGSLSAISRSLGSSSADFEKASQTLQAARVIRDEIVVTEAWPVRVIGILAELDTLLPAAQDALILGQFLPELLGVDGQKTYLLVAQNEDELRPTGGFISGAGLLVIENGDILSVDFANANLVDDWQNKPYGFPPLPYYEFMGMDIFLFRDANFWPDFPTSAETMMQLYTYGQDVPLDGIIAFNQNFVKLLLEGTGQLYVPELDITVNSDNVIEAMRQEWGPADGQADWIIQRKAFMGPFAKAFISQISGDLQSLDIRKLGENIYDAVEQRDLQIYMHDPLLAEALVATGWDGRLSKNPAQDYLMVVETNLGFNKVNAAIDRSINYEVILDDSGLGTALLTIDYSHGGDIVSEECRHGTIYSSETQYEDLISDCYWNYLRLFVPDGSQLIEASSHPVPAEQLLVEHPWSGNARQNIDPESGNTYIDNFMVLPSGQSARVTIRYLLPDVITTDDNKINHYLLAIDRQSGTGDQSMRLSLQLPPGSEFISSTPRATLIGDQSLLFEFELSEDRQIDVQYR